MASTQVQTWSNFLTVHANTSREEQVKTGATLNTMKSYLQSVCASWGVRNTKTRGSKVHIEEGAAGSRDGRRGQVEVFKGLSCNLHDVELAHFFFTAGARAL